MTPLRLLKEHWYPPPSGWDVMRMMPLPKLPVTGLRKTVLYFLHIDFSMAKFLNR
ncbi:hypothetical protein D3C76_1569730 [compost metagenome]